MWLCLNKGFLSIVKKDDLFLVRSRVKEHISNYFPNSEIKEFVGTDYQYRIFLSQEEFEDFLKILPNEITYDNFKKSIKDRSLYIFYSDIWFIGKRFWEKLSEF